MENNTDMKEVKLFSSSDEFVIDQICSVLKENNIPFVRKDHGSGSYMNLSMGQSIQEKVIFVNEKDYDNSLELISFISSSDDSDDNEEIKNDEKKFTLIRRLWGFLWFAMVISVLIILIFFA